MLGKTGASEGFQTSIAFDGTDHYTGRVSRKGVTRREVVFHVHGSGKAGLLEVKLKHLA